MQEQFKSHLVLEASLQPDALGAAENTQRHKISTVFKKILKHFEASIQPTFSLTLKLFCQSGLNV